MFDELKKMDLNEMMGILEKIMPKDMLKSEQKVNELKNLFGNMDLKCGNNPGGIIFIIIIILLWSNFISGNLQLVKNINVCQLFNINQ